MKTILIVDDEESIRMSLEGVLEDEGFRPVFAATGEEALSAIREENPDLVLLDIWMPGIDGLEAEPFESVTHPAANERLAGVGQCVLVRPLVECPL